MLIADRQEAKDKSQALSRHLLCMSVFLGVPDTICRLLKKRWQDLSLVWGSIWLRNWELLNCDIRDSTFQLSRHRPREDKSAEHITAVMISAIRCMTLWIMSSSHLSYPPRTPPSCNTVLAGPGSYLSFPQFVPASAIPFIDCSHNMLHSTFCLSLSFPLPPSNKPRRAPMFPEWNPAGGF